MLTPEIVVAVVKFRDLALNFCRGKCRASALKLEPAYICTPYSNLKECLCFNKSITTTENNT